MEKKYTSLSLPVPPMVKHCHDMATAALVGDRDGYCRALSSYAEEMARFLQELRVGMARAIVPSDPGGLTPREIAAHRRALDHIPPHNPTPSREE